MPDPSGSDGTVTDVKDHPIVAEISREIVRVHSRHYGRGPTKAKTVWREEIVICVLEEIYTKAEEMLVASGRFDQVRANRQVFQDTVEGLLRQVVEAATGRPVVSFLSQVSPEGVASEVFLLGHRTEGTAG